MNAPATWTKEQRAIIGSWLRDEAHDRIVDREQMHEEHGFDFVGKLEELADHIDPPKKPRRAP